MLKIIEKTKLWFCISSVIILIGFGFFVAKGFNYGIDFAGGTVLQADLKKSVSMDEIRGITSKYVNDATVSSIDKTGITIRSKSITNDQVAKIEDEINKKYGITSNTWQAQNVGPTIGQELRQKAILAVVIAWIAMLIYIALRFEIRFGVAAILAVIHDILITMSVYTIFQIPVNSSFVAAVLTVVGYSMNDTVVIFDRIRENMKYMKKVSFEELADVSMTETMSRSINTILNTLFSITAVYFIGVSDVKELALPLIIGIISGCYSSIFIASPIWVMWKNHDKKKKQVAKAV